MRLAFLALACTLLTGCVTYAVPPRSDLTVAVGSDALRVAGADLGIVLDSRTFVIDDESAVQAHIGGAATPQMAMRAFIAEQFPIALKKEAAFGRVFVTSQDVSVPEPQAGDTSVEVDGEVPDLVLFVDNLHQYRAKYPTNNPMGGGSFTQAVRQDVDYRLWDNRVGRMVASGRVESEESIFMVPTRGAYKGAVEEMAEKLTGRLGVRQ